MCGTYIYTLILCPNLPSNCILMVPTSEHFSKLSHLENSQLTKSKMGQQMGISPTSKNLKFHPRLIYDVFLKKSSLRRCNLYHGKYVSCIFGQNCRIQNQSFKVLFFQVRLWMVGVKHIIREMKVLSEEVCETKTS